jgi:hypothetical protein
VKPAEQPMAIFADQVAPEMVIEHPPPSGGWAGLVRVTQVRSYEGPLGPGRVILGVKLEDNSPFHYNCGIQMVWLMHRAPPMPVDRLLPGGEPS